MPKKLQKKADSFQLNEFSAAIVSPIPEYFVGHAMERLLQAAGWCVCNLRSAETHAARGVAIWAFPLRFEDLKALADKSLAPQQLWPEILNGQAYTALDQSKGTIRCCDLTDYDSVMHYAMHQKNELASSRCVPASHEPWIARRQPTDLRGLSLTTVAITPSWGTPKNRRTKALCGIATCSSSNEAATVVDRGAGLV